MTIKKLLICLFLCLTVICGCISYLVYETNCTHGVYEINISAHCISNNSVGNEWQTVYTLDGNTISNRTKFTVPLDSVEQKMIRVTITEYDKRNDTTSQNIAFHLRNGEEKTSKIIVTESDGKFKGNIAVWEVTVSVRLIKKIMFN